MNNRGVGKLKKKENKNLQEGHFESHMCSKFTTFTLQLWNWFATFTLERCYTTSFENLREKIVGVTCISTWLCLCGCLLWKERTSKWLEAQKNGQLDSPSVWVMLRSVAHKSEEMKARERRQYILGFPSLRPACFFTQLSHNLSTIHWCLPLLGDTLPVISPQTNTKETKNKHRSI